MHTIGQGQEMLSNNDDDDDDDNDEDDDGDDGDDGSNAHKWSGSGNVDQ